MKVTVKPREQFKRIMLFLTILVLILYAFGNTSDSVVYMYLREKFQWTLKKYTLYQSAKSILSIVGTLVGVYLLHKILKISEPILIIVGFFFIIASYIWFALAQTDWHLYLGNNLFIFGYCLICLFFSWKCTLRRWFRQSYD